MWRYAISLLMLSFVAAEKSESSKEEEKQTIPGAGLSIVFIFGGLLYGGIMKSITRRIKIPYNPLLLISGIILGIYHEHLGFIGEAAKLISELNPNGILAIFLPTLIFESAFKSEWYMLKKQMEQTLILGVPCVILASFMIMAGIKMIIGYDDSSYTWLQAFLLGCILCCTDIFSFVSKLKQFGTPQKLISLIEGESLFNYCTCVLIFQIINEVITDFDNYTFLGLAELLAFETIGGILFGLFFGFVALSCVKRISQDGILVVTIMVIFCYTIYLSAEFSLMKISGIIAIVTYGIFMGALGKAHIVGETEQYMDIFWSYAVFIAETSIFLIAGVLVGVNVFYIENIMNREEFFNIFKVYLIVLISRYLSIICFQRQLSRFGYGMQWKESIIIAYAGLKGAVGISFAMIVFQNNNYPFKMRNLFLLHVTGNSLLTLLINGMTTELVINYLHLSNITKVEYKFFKEYVQSFSECIEEKKANLMDEKYLNIVDWGEIDNKVGIKDFAKLEQQIEEIIKRDNFKNVGKFEKRQIFMLEQALQEFANRNNPMDNTAEKQFGQETLRFQEIAEVRKRFIKSLKYKYWIYHEQHNTMPDAVNFLLQSANFDLDTETEELDSWLWIKDQFTIHIKFVSGLRKNYVVGSIAREYLFSYISYCYDVVSSYVQANEEVRQDFREGRFVGNNQEAIDLILKESEENQKQAENFLVNYLKASFPEIDKDVKTRKASFNLLLSFQNIIERFNETGQLEAIEYDQLANLIDRKKLNLELHNPKWKFMPFKQALKLDPVFSYLPEKILNVIQKLTFFETYNSNEIIQTPSNVAKSIYFVRRGACTAEFVNGNLVYKELLIVGDAFGVESLVSTTYRSIITTNTLMVIVGIKTTHIEKIMNYFFEFEEAFWKKHLFSLLKMYESESITFLSRLEKNQLNLIVQELKLKRMEVGWHVLEEDCLFLRGSVQVYNQEQDRDIKAPPFTLFMKNKTQKINVLTKSSFLVGTLPEDEFERKQHSSRVHKSNRESLKLSSRVKFYESPLPQKIQESRSLSFQKEE